jgi:hypothetical protein
MAVLKYYDGDSWEPVVSALQGPTGVTGPTGVATGLPTGGVTGAVLAKTSTTDYATQWSVLDYEGAWVSYTPTYSNITLGNGTVSFRYKQIGKTVFVSGKFTFGSTSSFSGNPIGFSPPVNAAAQSDFMVGFSKLEDAATAGYVALVASSSASNFTIWISSANTTYTQQNGVNSTVPFTWGTNDYFNVSVTYEAA